LGLPELKINLKGQVTTIEGKKVKFRVGKYVTLPASNYRGKTFILEEIFFEDRSEPELRFGYYIIGRKGGRKGKWVWAQFCPLILKEDLQKIIELAKREGIL
jgi:hypothetical protein